ncbi:hypothetical protein QCA50_012637 [Cerrena zonata]|uniref:Reverse transcriptase zinc-binding domain-containing protein n=1 Tax=Cerrena zonata TaxID=2478898 RepID=A0AAW0FTD5_9APHY
MHSWLRWLQETPYVFSFDSNWKRDDISVFPDALYILREEPVLPTRALKEAFRLATEGHVSWLSDLKHALRRLPVPVEFSYAEWPTIDSVNEVIGHVKSALLLHLQQTVDLAIRLPILQLRLDPLGEGEKFPRKHVLLFRKYLEIPTLKHRRALTRLLVGEHPIAIERLRRDNIPREWRICRYCQRRGVVEDEAHILLECISSHALEDCRLQFISSMAGLLPLVTRRTPHREHRLSLIIQALACKETLGHVAGFVADVFDILEVTPPLEIRSVEQYLELDAYWHV